MSTRSTSNEPSEVTVFVVDDDDAMRESLTFLLDSVGLSSRSFASAREFLDAYDRSQRGCLLVDVRMPGMSGLELQALLRQDEIQLPVIVMTAFADVPMAVRAMRGGAIDFIEKPFNEQLLLDRVQQALTRERELHRGEERQREARERLERLTAREREVMTLVVQGLLNKQIASELHLSPKTVEQHRARVMSKMEANSLAELVRTGLLAGIE